jgi:hypothetical protein
MSKESVRANAILERDFNITFWKPEAARTICNTYDEMVNDLDISDDDAASIIRAIWNAACGEYGE